MRIATLTRAVPAVAVTIYLALAPQPRADEYPNQPIELICSTSPGSGAAVWCQMMANEMAKEYCLGVPINVSFKSGGSNHEPAVYTVGKPADGYTLLHISGSWPGYFNLPHFTVSFDDFEFVARIEQTLYAIGVHEDSPFQTFQEVLDYAKKHPGELVMGSNKVGSLHHRHHERLMTAAGVDIRFVPYEGTGAVVKDIIGEHLPIGMAQPGKWLSHVEAGNARVLLLLNEERLDHPLFKDVPTPMEVGLDYDFPHQWQGFLVKKGTPDSVIDKIAACGEKAVKSTAYEQYMANNPHVIPNFSADRKALAEQFRKDLKDTRTFMVENKIIAD